VLDLTQFESLGAALAAGIEKWPDEVCLIEADRDRERSRYTYRQFSDAALPFAQALQQAGLRPGARAAIIMTNQPKWLISAYAIFGSGGVLVPLDYKLSAGEHLALLDHSQSQFLVVEYPVWRAIMQAADFQKQDNATVFVTEAPSGVDLAGACRWEQASALQSSEESGPEFRPRKRWDPACIVYSSGTGGRPKGCVLTHENYLEQCRALTSVFPFAPGVRYLSILPTNHAVDFMVGFIGPFVCGACVVHLRTLRPEYVRDAFPRYKITHTTLVPLVLKNLERGLRERFEKLPSVKKKVFNALVAINHTLTKGYPNVEFSRWLLPQVHKAFGGELQAMFVGGAFTEASTLEFFFDFGIPIANGYGLTEAGTVLTLNDFNPFRADTVGKPLPGTELRILNPDRDGIGEVAARGPTVMSHYLDDPELTAETIVDGWLLTGDLGRLDSRGHLHLFGRKKNMIVTAEGKNIYPEDIENVFEGLPVKEFCVFAANYLWPQHTMIGEQLVIVVHPEPGQEFTEKTAADLNARNQRLLNYKRISGWVLWDQDFPRTASLKIKRHILAEEIRARLQRDAIVPL
jgi:long-chain acyl-CoA synthetase